MSDAPRRFAPSDQEDREMSILRWYIGLYPAVSRGSDGTARRVIGPLPEQGAFLLPMILAAWFGLVTGLVELGLLQARNHFSGWSSLSALQISRHYTWMIPSANFVVFAAVGVCLSLLARVWPRDSARISHLLLTFLAFLALLLTIPGLYKFACLALAAGLSNVTIRLIPEHSSRFRRFVAASLPVLFVVVAAHVAWKGTVALAEERWARTWLPASRPGAPNVLLVVMDTVRADRLSVHGYHRDTTPNLARLARGGIVFEQARSTAPWTLPAHASLFTGRWPRETGAGAERPLDGSLPTLAEFLSRQGYLTAGFVANTYYCNSWFGLDKGFARYEDFYDEDLVVSFAETLRCSALGRSLVQLMRMPLGTQRRRKDAAQIRTDFLDWLAEQEGGRPFFAFLNLFDAHTPYLLPEGDHKHFGLRPEGPAEVALLHEWDRRSKRDIPERDRNLVNDAYDDCIGYIDSELGKLFDELDRRGILENTLVIVTSDHGEEIGEHGLYGHGKSLYAQELHVPLVILSPRGRAPALKVTDAVSLRDIPATVADLLGHAGASPFPGRSLARYWRRGSAASDPRDGVAFSEVALRDKVRNSPNRPPAWRGPMQSLVAEGKSYIRNADGREELFDLATDPTESRDLAGSPGTEALLARLRPELDRLIADENAR
jgi:arylsulfatase A-like enzyme